MDQTEKERLIYIFDVFTEFCKYWNTKNNIVTPNYFDKEMSIFRKNLENEKKIKNIEYTIMVECITPLLNEKNKQTVSDFYAFIKERGISLSELKSGNNKINRVKKKGIQKESEYEFVMHYLSDLDVGENDDEIAELSKLIYDWEHRVL